MQNVSGLNVTELVNRVEKSIATVERYIRILRKKDLVKYRGAKKTGAIITQARN
ncbi:MAG: ArsR family transcriptional regulator [Bacteroidales bacterium]|nr:ArsR family transcriptional regulator [Bacteroidales bacterium]